MNTNRVIGIKCFDMDLTCRGFQFEIGKSYEIQGELSMCKNGFHFHHHNQLEHVFDYYDNIPETRYCLVIGEGVMMDDKKSVARKITIVKELSLQEVIDIRTRKMIKHGITENQDKYCGIVTQTGWRGLAGQTGHQGIAIQISYSGMASQTGRYGSAIQTGDCGLAGQTGEKGMAIQKGYRGIASQTGYHGSAMQDGEYGIAIVTGINGRAMVKNSKGAIVIQNWVQGDGDWQVIGRLCAGVGDTLPNGEVMATNTWYWYEDGELRSTKNKL